jgi:addiction module HigA family antidote
MVPAFLTDLRMTQREFADAIGVSRVRLNELIHGRCAVTPDTALRLERALGESARWWLGLQLEYDLWRAMHSPEMECIRSVTALWTRGPGRAGATAKPVTLARCRPNAQQRVEECSASRSAGNERVDGGRVTRKVEPSPNSLSTLMSPP